MEQAGLAKIGAPPLSVSLERILQDWRGACARAELYLEALGFEPERRPQLARLALADAVQEASPDAHGGAFSDTLEAMRRRLMESYPVSGAASAPHPFAAWRLEVALAGRSPRDTARPGRAVPLHWGGALRSMPPLRRRSMAANRYTGGLWRGAITRQRPPAAGPAKAGRAAWRSAATRRRLLLAFLVFLPGLVASQYMLEFLPYKGGNWLEIAITVLFAMLFSWVSVGFWIALFGFFILLRGKDRFAISSCDPASAAPVARDAGARTAIVMPICEEPVERVLAGLKVLRRSLERAGGVRDFDFFILSDTRGPELWVSEEEGWFEWCRETDGFAGIFYRRRRVSVKRKSGNIADFCRRWGSLYRYMVVLDADSVMTGPALIKLVRLMEARPEVGMIQTFPMSVNRSTLFARLQQFSSRLYGPMFAAGLHYWELGDGQYWGHNAIIRVAPFMEHCSLPHLPGRPPLGGEILSHDFVESALMGSAGWTVWLAYDIPGSYEEPPSSLVEEMGRSRRWCQGNMQHLRLAFARGLAGVHRALFLNGAFSYISACLWFGFLILGSGEAVWQSLSGPTYFAAPGPTLFPQWPAWHPAVALALMAVTGAILFAPKFLAAALALRQDRARRFGGPAKLAASLTLELLLSALFAPIRMMFHARFVAATWLGRAVTWRSQGREDAELSWKDGLRYFGLDTAVGAAWGFGVHRLAPDYFQWLIPIVAALVLSVPLAVLASRVKLGERLRTLGLLLIPEEKTPVPELEELGRELLAARSAEARRVRLSARDGFVRAVTDPCTNALHSQLLGGDRRWEPSRRGRREALRSWALMSGPQGLGPAERRALLGDGQAVRELHREVWQLEGAAAGRWLAGL